MFDLWVPKAKGTLGVVGNTRANRYQALANDDEAEDFARPGDLF